MRIKLAALTLAGGRAGRLKFRSWAQTSASGSAESSARWNCFHNAVSWCCLLSLINVLDLSEQHVVSTKGKLSAGYARSPF